MGIILKEIPKHAMLDPESRVQELEAILDNMAHEIEQAKRVLDIAEDLQSAIARGRGERKPARGAEDSAAGESFNNDIPTALRALIPHLSGQSGQALYENVVEAIVNSNYNSAKKKLAAEDHMAASYRLRGIKGAITKYDLYSDIDAEVIVVREGEYIRLATPEEVAGGKRPKNKST